MSSNTIRFKVLKDVRGAIMRVLPTLENSDVIIAHTEPTRIRPRVPYLVLELTDEGDEQVATERWYTDGTRNRWAAFEATVRVTAVGLAATDWLSTFRLYLDEVELPARELGRVPATQVPVRDAFEWRANLDLGVSYRIYATDDADVVEEASVTATLGDTAVSTISTED